KGEFDKAKTALEAIPAADRNGDLALVPYLQADCIMRLVPTRVEDALGAGKAQEELTQAIDLLEGYIGSDPKGAQTPDALLKLGQCRMRLAALIGTPKEKGEALAVARATYERLLKDFPQSPLGPQALLERAKTIAQSTPDKNPAINELRRFLTDPLRQAPVAPM